MSVDSKREQRSTIEIAGKRYSNITITNKDDEPVVVITPSELITMKGYKVQFDVGEN